MRASLALTAILIAVPVVSVVGDERAKKSGLSFERDVRPILKTHCFHCHGETKELAGDLDLRLRRFLVRGGESGAAISVGKPQKSPLLARMRAGEMPPEDVESRPTGKEIATIAAWIAAGAKVDEVEPEKLAPGIHISQTERRFWAFQPVQRPALPSVKNWARVRSPIDQFVLARLEAKQLSFNPEAQRRKLLRRVYLGLTGLPPTPAETEQFLADRSSQAYERLVDRVLNSPRYGERWGRHWLDVAGYADSEGYTDDDLQRPNAFKYRDYVIRAHNDDKPFNEFLLEQIAGDELAGRLKNLNPRQVEQMVATGYLRMAPDGTASGGVDQPVARNEVIAKTLEIFSTSVLGLTVGCAQCHNHRYDPISQADYYRMRAIFEPAFNWKKWRTPTARRISLYTDADRQRAAEVEAEARKILAQRTKKQNEFIQETLEKELAKLPAETRETVRKARETPAAKRSAKQKALLRQHPSVNVSAGSLYLYNRKAADTLKKMASDAAKVRARKPKEEFVRALSESGALPKTFVFHRGDHQQPTDEVGPDELSVLKTKSATISISAKDSRMASSGRRLAYARWLTNGSHPLTARVIVNRVWHQYFGRGIVDTPGDFGQLGGRPSHPQLLDWLADEFVRRGWSLKTLHRLILTSSVFRQSSEARHRGLQQDADNRLLWRMSIRRLEAEAVRDSTLAVSGKLNTKAFGPPIPVMADRVGRFIIGRENLNAGRPGPVIDMKDEVHRRSVYVQVRRSRPLAVLETFDAPRMDPNCTARNSSTVTPQSLLLMNSDFTLQYAEHFADRLRSAESELDGQIRLAWQLAFTRLPTKDELTESRAFVAAQREVFNQQSQASRRKNPKAAAGNAEAEALKSLCHALLSSNEFLYVD